LFDFRHPSVLRSTALKENEAFHVHLMDAANLIRRSGLHNQPAVIDGAARRLDN
jgi:hypothetical protein